MSGTVSGKPVRHRGEGRWVLQGGWLCLTIIDTATPPAYVASVAFRDTLALAADGASGSLLLESQQNDGSWSTFASYRLTRAR